MDHSRETCWCLPASEEPSHAGSRAQSVPLKGRRLRWSVLLAAGVTLAAIAAGCGGEKGSTSFSRVHFRALDGVLLDGRLYGRGNDAVILVHMGRSGDTQRDWQDLAIVLADRGYLVLTYDRRGVCPRQGAGCSKGNDDYASSWKDIVGAARLLRRRGVQRYGVVGASIGATAALYAAALSRIHPAALIEFAGADSGTWFFRRPMINRIAGTKLFLSAKNDPYQAEVSARVWFRWASPPKDIELLPGADHGTDTLAPKNPLRGRVEKLIASFLDHAFHP
jgi:dienelactone hydrolase